MPRQGERFVYHVTPDASGESWIVTLENGNLRRAFDTKEAAEKFAKYRARLNQLSQVKVHRQDGTMDYESAYGEDPRNISG